MTYKEMREAAGMSVRDVAAQLKLQFPRISPAGVSYAENSGQSGLTYTRDAAAVLRYITGADKSRVAEKRRCPVRIQARLTEAESAALNNAREVMGHSTTNDALRYALRLYIAQAKKRAAGTAGTVADGKANFYTPSIRAER